MSKSSVRESFTVSLILGIEKVWIWRGLGSFKIFRRIFFCLTAPKNFVGESFGVSEIFWHRKISCLRGLCYDFLSKIICLTLPKHFVEEPFRAVYQEVSGSQKVFA